MQDGMTALHWAALAKSEATVKLLLKSGANFKVRNNVNITVYYALSHFC